MFGRIRASPSSLESLEGSPSKILKDDSFSIYEATLMKLKLGAKRDTPSVQIEEEEFTKDCSVTDEVSMDVDCTPATETASSSRVDDNITTLMDTDCSSIATTHSTITCISETVSTENNLEQPRQNNVSILHFFKIKDPGPGNLSSAETGSCGSASSSGSVVSDGTRSELCE